MSDFVFEDAQCLSRRFIIHSSTKDGGQMDGRWHVGRWQGQVHVSTAWNGTARWATIVLDILVGTPWTPAPPTLSILKAPQ